MVSLQQLDVTKYFFRIEHKDIASRLNHVGLRVQPKRLNLVFPIHDSLEILEVLFNS